MISSLKTGHGPHLLRDFYKDFQNSQLDAQQCDNQLDDQDARVDRLDFGNEQVMVYPNGLAIRDLNRDGDTISLVWLSGHGLDQTGRLQMHQEGYERDREGCYSYPLDLQGPPNTAFDPPDAQRISAQQFVAADRAFEQQWLLAA